MKDEMLNKIIRSGLLMVLVISLMAIYTGSCVQAREYNNSEPSVAVVDERGVGQTEKEVTKGMNEQVQYDASTSTLSWNIGSDYKLEEGYVYYITFHVEDGNIYREEARLIKQ